MCRLVALTGTQTNVRGDPQLRTLGSWPVTKLTANTNCVGQTVGMREFGVSHLGRIHLENKPRPREAAGQGAGRAGTQASRRGRRGRQCTQSWETLQGRTAAQPRAPARPTSHPVPGPPPPAPTCLVFFFPKFLMYMSYSFTGGRSKRENVNEKSRSMSRSSFALRVL